MSVLKSNFNGIQHIGVPVTDIERSRVFYTRLGFISAMDRSFEHNGDSGQCSMMKRDSVIMELYQMPPAELEEIRQRGNGRIDHVTFDVDDIDQAFAELKDAGFEIEEDAPVFIDFWDNGTKYFMVAGPDGERLEFNQIL
ncbi:VOC family protein [Pontiella sulfatireligans]|uniref:VOC domain-containing protein n=1 Tax=Pontiella sulfatireligans TaxID=2750658 RepID=A0A6C2URU1_9BACT|nr:VOC family protein [Pontiella sulfatireligans]VGO22673.1 hypothetical protein SCARR_04768 [Pontiella sulfatireligans]